jgi:UDP-2,3-diacylglucosamine pyrophosphatase LpxH
LPYWSLASFLKHKVKNAVSYIVAFEEALAREARARGLDGVICGHIHQAEIRDIDGILYCNDGDWVESLTALVETHDGSLRIVHWHEVLATAAVDRDVPAIAPEPAFATMQDQWASAR